MAQTATQPSLEPRLDFRATEARGRSDPSLKTTLTVGDVQRFLGKSKRAFYLLRCDGAQGFPAPFVIQGRDHWLMRDILEWIQARRRHDAVPGRVSGGTAPTGGA